MLRKMISLGLLACTVVYVGCNRKPPKDPIAEIPGRLDMVFGNDCKDYGLKSDALVLRSDGTFDQYTVAQDGRQFETKGQHWRFTPPSTIVLDQRRDFFTAQHYKNLVGVPEFESIIVKFSSPPSIVFNPDSDCFYTKSEGGIDKGTGVPE